MIQDFGVFVAPTSEECMISINDGGESECIKMEWVTLPCHVS
jgi:hypothetical protein